MRQRRRWAVLAFAGGVALVPLASAFACGVQTSISVSPIEAMPGQQVTGSGKGFSTSHGGAPAAEPVVLHWNAQAGPVLWTGRPDATGNIVFYFVVPANAAEGPAMLFATQNNADGIPAPGTPARAALTVLPLPVTTTTTTIAEPVTTVVTLPPATLPVETPQAVIPAAAPAAAVVATKTVAPKVTAASATTAVAPSTAAPTATADATLPPPAPLSPAAPPPSEPVVSLAARPTSSDDSGSSPAPALVLVTVLLAGAGATFATRRLRRRASPTSA